MCMYAHATGTVPLAACAPSLMRGTVPDQSEPTPLIPLTLYHYHYTPIPLTPYHYHSSYLKPSLPSLASGLPGSGARHL